LKNLSNSTKNNDENPFSKKTFFDQKINFLAHSEDCNWPNFIYLLIVSHFGENMQNSDQKQSTESRKRWDISSRHLGQKGTEFKA
jgi:hypothetical protein